MIDMRSEHTHMSSTTNVKSPSVHTEFGDEKQKRSKKL